MERGTKGRVHSFESFGSVDGPGVRFVVFMQGCRMRCRYCHNPDTWDASAGSEVSAGEVLKKALRYREYWGEKGGITVSGGEPLLQMGFVAELFTLAKKEGVSTALDTAAGPFTLGGAWLGEFDRLMEATDLVLLDLKEIDREKHKRLTGASNGAALACAKYLSRKGKPVWIRHVLVPGWTDDREDLEKLGAFIAGLKNVKKVEVLPFHNLAAFKWDALHIKYSLRDTPAPSRESVSMAKQLLGAV